MKVFLFIICILFCACSDRSKRDGFTKVYFISSGDQKSGATGIGDLLGGINVYGFNIASPQDSGGFFFRPGESFPDGIWIKNGDYKFYALASDQTSLYFDANQMYAGKTDIISLTGGQRLVDITISNQTYLKKFRVVLCSEDGLICPIVGLPYSDARIKIYYYVKNFDGTVNYVRGLESACLPLYDGGGWSYPFSYSNSVVMPEISLDSSMLGTGFPFVIEYFAGTSCTRPASNFFHFPFGFSPALDYRINAVSLYEYDIRLPVVKDGAFNLVSIDSAGSITPIKEVQIAVDQKMVLAGSKIVFVGNDFLGKELWVSDGTEANTGMLKDIYSGTTGSNPRGFKYISNLNKAFFWSNDGVNGEELWVTDGTYSGTQMVADINLSGDSYPGFDSEFLYFTTTSKVYFYANDGINGDELHMTSGLVGNHDLVKNVNDSSNQEMLEEYNFIGTDGINIYYNNFGPTVASISMFYTDGTINNSTQATNPAASSNAKSFVSDVANSRMYFKTFAESSMGYEPHFISNGIRTFIKDIYPITPSGWGEFNRPILTPGGTIYFYANDGTNGEELWKTTDGTGANTVMVKDIYPGSSGSSSGTEPMVWDDTNNLLYFTADDGIHGAELWKSDGTSGGTVLVKDIESGVTGSSPKNLVMFSGKVYFWAQVDGVFNLFSSSGDAASTVRLTNFTPDFQSGGTMPLLEYSGKLYTGMNIR